MVGNRRKARTKEGERKEDRKKLRSFFVLFRSICELLSNKVESDSIISSSLIRLHNHRCFTEQERSEKVLTLVANQLHWIFCVIKCLKLALVQV